MRLIFLAALLSIFFSAAHAEERIALVVGNTVFAGAPRVANAAANADSMTFALRGLGFDVTEMVDARHVDLLAAMENFRARLVAGDAVGLFYYSGYAAHVEASNFLVPSDFGLPTQPAFADVGATGIILDALLQAESAGGLKIVLLDPVMPPADLINDLKPGLAGIAPAQNTIVMVSAEPDGAASRQSDADTVFTNALVRRLAETGASIEAILNEVRADVLLDTQFRQVPEIVSPISGVPDFIPSVPAADPDMAGNPPTGVDPAPPVPDTQFQVIVRDPEPGDGSGDFGGLFDPPEQKAIPLDSAEGGGGGGFDGSQLGEEPVLPDMPAMSSDGGGSVEPAPESAAPDEIAPGGGDRGFLENLGSASDDAESPHYQEQAALEEQAAALEAQKRYEAELARQQEEAKANAGQTQMEEAASPEAAIEPQPLPPPPPMAFPEQPAAVELVRHPTLDAPDQVVSGQQFTVSVALTEDQITPDVTVRAGPDSSVTPEGALEFSMPASAEEWPIDIDLLAAGFDLADAGAWSRRVMLYKVGDSDFARFTLKPRALAGDYKPRQLIARLYHEGRFLGSVSRPVTVFRDQVAMDGAGAAGAAPAMLLMVAGAAETPPPALTTDIKIGGGAEDVPDLDVTIHYSDPDKLGDGLIIVHSPHIGAPVSAEFTTPEGMNVWLDTEYMRLVTLGLQVRGAKPLQGQAPAASKEFITKVAEGFGSDLYRNYVPGAFKDVFWSLKARGALHSIQITSNSPVLPWELVRPEAPDGTDDGFLGIKYRLARWAPRSSGRQVDRPLDRMPFTGVATIAPAYDNNLELPFQKVEVDALSKLAGFRLVDGDFSSFERLVGEVSTGFIHFSGHGEVNDPGTGAPVFAIQLLDQALDPTTWRALTFAPHDKGNPFFFFNACDSGRARSLGGFVQGWGPAVLASGASGFIGGMWPLTDRTAASFSTSFYSGIADHLKDGPVYLAEVLQRVRQQFYETGDPTYLAYTFYGNANLQIVSR